MLFNINETVRVKLTDFGRQALQRQHVEFWASVGRVEPYPHTPPKEDAAGWSEWQLHSLMHELGHLCRMGGICRSRRKSRLWSGSPGVLNVELGPGGRRGL